MNITSKVLMKNKGKEISITLRGESSLLVGDLVDYDGEFIEIHEDGCNFNIYVPVQNVVMIYGAKKDE